MLEQLRKINSNKFFRLNAIFFIGSLVISFINYLYYPILGRILSVESFGEVQVSISIFTQLSIFFSVLSLITVNIVSNSEDKNEVEKTLNEFQKLSFYISIALLVLFILIAPVLQTAFKFESSLPFIMIILILLSNIPQVFKNAYLRGKSDFIGTSIGGIITSSAKIVVSAILVYLGFKTLGALGGLVIANLINFAYISFRVKKHGFKAVKSLNKMPNWELIKPQLPYAGLVLITSLVISLYSSIDVTIVKYLFPQDVAGKYAGISVISNIVLFITGSFSVVILSAVKRNLEKSENNKLLIKSFILTLTIGGIVTTIFVLFPNQVVNILFGSKYAEFAYLLPYLSISMLLISLSSLLINFNIALRNFKVAICVVIGAIVTLVILLINHNFVSDIVKSLLTGSSIMFTLLFLLTTYKSIIIKKIS